ncbi:MAG: hypothetical protein Q9191_003910 [Dirinaria sp. TL-2023a]
MGFTDLFSDLYASFTAEVHADAPSEDQEEEGGEEESGEDKGEESGEESGEGGDEEGDEGGDDEGGDDDAEEEEEEEEEEEPEDPKPKLEAGKFLVFLEIQQCHTFNLWSYTACSPGLDNSSSSNLSQPASTSSPFQRLNCIFYVAYQNHTCARSLLMLHLSQNVPNPSNAPLTSITSTLVLHEYGSKKKTQIIPARKKTALKNFSTSSIAPRSVRHRSSLGYSSEGRKIHSLDGRKGSITYRVKECRMHVIELGTFELVQLYFCGPQADRLDS